ncbi:hypothetical protein Tco_1156938 [Tanacetum coccineum]|uniref:Uncharacterized protein n=1 Tax=Tanacetum coccineum TaxID=301880 RepID=A0ABQ5AQ02_9ASTR
MGEQRGGRVVSSAGESGGVLQSEGPERMCCREKRCRYEEKDCMVQKEGSYLGVESRVRNKESGSEIGEKGGVGRKKRRESVREEGERVRMEWQKRNKEKKEGNKRRGRKGEKRSGGGWLVEEEKKEDKWEKGKIGVEEREREVEIEVRESGK